MSSGFVAEEAIRSVVLEVCTVGLYQGPSGFGDNLFSKVGGFWAASVEDCRSGAFLVAIE